MEQTDIWECRHGWEKMMTSYGPFAMNS